MNKLKLFTFVILSTILFASCFGILHDQLTYTISPEYYTKFKFIQFRLTSEGIPMQMHDRTGALIVGMMATWWMGLIIGIIYAAILLFIKTEQSLYKLYFKTVLITFGITISASILGYFYGKFIVDAKELNWFLPENLVYLSDFVTAGSIHNASYLGGVFGLMCGTLYLLLLKEKFKSLERTLKIHSNKKRE